MEDKECDFYTHICNIRCYVNVVELNKQVYTLMSRMETMYRQVCYTF